ncbi:neuronal acetylcholine receptor subunit alpha-2-like [Mya arenaria]|uniref:neuronal acetylcholine receptor subunit alpha-2-like n=1 Tax=Mya arenaria TaxID=6604 RepID=UPI0022E57096|nr:neuronal acetylcholine receptor subunit alpha-2-like [Mya arenaria]
MVPLTKVLVVYMFMAWCDYFIVKQTTQAAVGEAQMVPVIPVYEDSSDDVRNSLTTKATKENGQMSTIETGTNKATLSLQASGTTSIESTTSTLDLQSTSGHIFTTSTSTTSPTSGLGLPAVVTSDYKYDNIEETASEYTYYYTYYNDEMTEESTTHDIIGEASITYSTSTMTTGAISDPSADMPFYIQPFDVGSTISSFEELPDQTTHSNPVEISTAISSTHGKTTTHTNLGQTTAIDPTTAHSFTTKKGRLTKFEEAKLMYSRLLTNYDTRIRPIQNQTKPVYVNTKFVPLSVVEFDTSKQRFSMLGYFRIRWTDEQMIWRPKLFQYIDHVRLATTELWTPNIVISKSFDGHGGVGNPETDILMVSWNGIVQWVPDSTYSVVCDVDIQYFPFDDQTCTVTYYAADETVDTVELDHYLGTDMSEYSENPSWLIVGASRNRYVKENNWYIDVKFRLQRRANFAAFTLITPLMMLAFLNICVFLVPINSGEKGSFSVTMFLSYGIFFTMISDSLPHNSLQISFFILLIVALLCLSVVAVFYTVIQAKLVTVIGSKQCPITCLRKLRWSKVNKVTPIEHYIETGKQDPEDEPYTWKDFLEHLDTFLFVLFLVTILLITALFFAILMRNVATVDNMFDEDPETTKRSTPVTTVASG